jgi:hypothetical protein
MTTDIIANYERAKLEGAGYRVSLRKDIIAITQLNYVLDMANEVAVIDKLAVDNDKPLKDIGRLRLILLSPSGVINEYIAGDNYNGFVLNRMVKCKVYDSLDPSTPPDPNIILPLKLHVIRLTPYKQ